MNDNQIHNIVGVYLAAGKSMRMGQDKLILALEGEQLGNKALKAAKSSLLSKTYIISRSERLRTLDIPKDNFFEVIQCEKSFYGISQSIKCGVRGAKMGGASGIMIMLADQPFITVAMINGLIDAYLSSHYDYLAAANKGIPQPPILFSYTMFSELLKLDGDHGAKSLLYNPKHHGKYIEFENEKLFRDIDTKEDYLALLKDLE